MHSKSIINFILTHDESFNIVKIYFDRLISENRLRTLRFTVRMELPDENQYPTQYGVKYQSKT